MQTLRTALALSILAAAVVASATPVTYRVTQNVGSLSLSQPEVSDGFLLLDFQLTDGKNVGNGNSSVAISNLSLTGGAFDFGAQPFPDLGNVVSGSGHSFTLRDGDGAGNEIADRALVFRVTSSTAVLRYDFTLDWTGIDAPTPDGFNVAMLYRTGAGAFDFNVVPTTGPTKNELVNFVFDGGPTTTPLAFGVDRTFASTRSTLGDQRFGNLGNPTIQAVPEPSTLAAIGLAGAALARRRKKA